MAFTKLSSLAWLALSFSIASQGMARSVNLVERCVPCQAQSAVQQIQDTPAFKECGTACQPLGTQFEQCFGSSGQDFSAGLKCACQVKDPCDKCRTCLEGLHSTMDSDLDGILGTFEVIATFAASVCLGPSGPTNAATFSSSIIDLALAVETVDVVVPAETATTATVTTLPCTSCDENIQAGDSSYIDSVPTTSVLGDVAITTGTPVGNVDLQAAQTVASGGSTKTCRAKTSSGDVASTAIVAVSVPTTGVVVDALSNSNCSDSVVGTGGLASDAAAASGAANSTSIVKAASHASSAAGPSMSFNLFDSSVMILLVTVVPSIAQAIARGL